MKGFYTFMVVVLALIGASLSAQPLSITLESADAPAGQILCLDLTGDDFDNVSGFQFSINYDPAILAFSSATGSTLVGQPVFIQNSAPGDLRISWNTFGANGIMESDPFVIGEICFSVLVEEETSVVFSNSPIVTEFLDASGNNITVFTSNDATINAGSGGGPTCSDGIQNGNETGVDCGGPDCSPCTSCSDGIQNGNETGIDCGGPDCPACPVGGDDLLFFMSSGSGAAGTEVCLDVTTQNFTAIGGFQYTINYDPAVVSFSGVTNLAFIDISVVQPAAFPGQIRVSWNYFQPNTDGETLPNNAVVFTICFNVTQVTGTDVVFSGNPIGIEGFNGEGDELNVVLSNGTINGGGVLPTCNDGIQNGNETGIDCGGSCPACPPTGASCTVNPGELTICAEEFCDAEVGDQICIDFEVTNFTAVVGFEFKVIYPGANLEFVNGTSNIALLGGATLTSPNDGEVRVLWFDPTPQFQGATIANTATLVNLCFTVQNTATSSVTVIDESFSNPDGEINPVVIFNGSVNSANCGGVTPTCNDGIQNGNETGVDCGGPDCPPCTTCNDGIQNGNETGIDCGGSCPACPPTGASCTVNPGELTICAEEFCDAEVGDQICIDFEVTNFTAIVGFEFKVIYPGANLEFVNGTSNIALLGGATLTSPNDGEVRVLWFDPTPQFQGATIANTATLVNLCFTVQNTATSSFTVIDESFSNLDGEISPVVIFNGSVNSANCGGVTPTCNDGIQNGNETGVDCGGPDCAVCPPAGNVCTVNPGELTVCADEICNAEIGDQVCLDIDVTNFTNVVGFEFKVIYPGGNLNYNSGTSNPALLGGATLNNPNDGEVRILWFDPTPQFEGATIAGTASLVNLCFTVENAATSTITIIDQSFSNQSGEINPVAIYFGSINDPSCSNDPPTCNDGIQNGNETGVDCGGPDCAACPPTGPVCTVNPGELTMCVEEFCDAEVGDEVCLDFEITNFTQVVGFEFKVIYPGANLDYTSGTSNALLLGGATINNNNDGEVRVLWFDPTPQFEGATIPGTDVLITLCFTVENAATSSVTVIDESFSNQTGVINPTVIFDGSINGADCGGASPTCNDGIQNGNETGVDCGGPDCAACPVEPQCTVNGDELTVCVEEVCGDVGDQVCVDFDVTNFVDIVGFEFKVAYPAGTLNYVAGSATSNAALLGGVTVSNPSDGELRFLWFDPTPTFEGATIPGTQVMVNVCFTIENATAAPLTVFDDSFNDVDGPVVPYTIFNGSINGAGCGGNPVCNFNGVQDGLETGVDCGGPLCPPCSTGQEDLTINVSSATVDVGNQACLDVTVADFNDVRLLNLTLNFDQTALQVSSILTTSQLPGFNISNFTIDQANGTIDINWTGNVGAALNNNTVLFTVCFTALTEATTNVTFDGGSNALDGTGNQITLILNGGTVTATNNFDNLTFVMGSGSGPANSQVCLDILTYNFTDITSFSFTINYDPLQLSFNELLANAAFPPGGGYQVTNPSPGEIRVIWLYNPPDFAGITVPDGTSAGEVCFDVIIACEAPVEITGSATDIAATDNNGTSLPVTTLDGTINAGVPCDGGPTAENLIIDIQNANGLAGEEVCVDVLVTNFISINELSFTLNYDASVLSFAGVENFGLASITPANFTVGPLGTITFQWDSPSALGQTIANGGTMFSLCFIVDDVVQTPINFAGTPVPIQAQNGAGANVGVIVNNGMINPNAPLGDELTLVMCCVDGEVGDIVDIDIKAYNFENIVGFQFSVNYDPTQLSFISETGNDALDFIFITNTVDGELRIQWADNGGNPQTIPDGVVLTGFRFEILDMEAATVVFSDMPIGVEFISNEGVVPADMINLINCSINGSAAPVIVSADIQQPTCHDDTDGNITLTVTGPTNISYNWIPNPSGSTGPVLENLGPGTYMVQVVNNDTGESTTESFTVTAPPQLNVSAINVQNVSCAGDANGLIALAINGGISANGMYTIDWSGNLQDNLLQQTGLDGGMYGVTVTDDNGCMRSLSFEILEPNSLPAFNGLVTDIGDVPGSVNVTVVPGSGTPGYSFDWTGPGAFSADTEDISGLTEPGLYCLTMTDANGCGVTNCYEVNATLRITDVTIVQGCFGEPGSIDITVSGGDGAYVYAWTGPNDFTAATEDVMGLEPGVYTVIVTSGSESVTANYTLEQGSEITATAVIAQATEGDNGSIDLMPTGGSQPYSYLWSNGETTQDLMNLEVGEYCVTITDSQSCENGDGTLCFEVTAEALAIVSTATTATTCFDSQDGTATVILNNGLAPFTATVEPGGLMTTFNTDTLAFNLPGGSYTITIVDALDDTITTDVIVDAPEPVSLDEIIVVSDADDGICAGSITIAPVGGTPPYNINWNVGLTGPQIGGLCAGLYTATIVDDNGCTFVFADIEVLQVSASGAVTNVACEGGADGAIDLTVNSGIAPYTYAWRVMGNPAIIATTQDLMNVPAGTYEVVITDDTGQSFTLAFTVSTTLGFSLTTAVTSNYNGSAVSCNGNADGSARVDISGFGDFDFQWFSGTTLVGSDSILMGIGAGTYRVEVTNANGCFAEDSVTITEPMPLSLTSEITDVSCFNERDGRIRVTVSGGTPTYNYEWSNGGTLNQIQFLEEGDYEVFINDANGCIINQDFTVDGPPELIATVETTDATDGCNGTVTVIPLAGGSTNFNYNWQQLPQQGNNPVALDLCPGDYMIDVFDENRCQTVTVVATVRDRRFPCLSERNVITPNGDGLNESFILFCTDGGEINNNTLEIYNRWGQLVYQVADYNCSTDGGLNCFEGRTNNGSVLPAGPYYYVLDYTNPIGELQQKRGSITIVLE